MSHCRARQLAQPQGSRPVDGGHTTNDILRAVPPNEAMHLTALRTAGDRQRVRPAITQKAHPQLWSWPLPVESLEQSPIEFRSNEYGPLGALRWSGLLLRRLRFNRLGLHQR